MKNTVAHPLLVALFISLPFYWLLRCPEAAGVGISDEQINNMIDAVHRADQAFSENDLETYLSYTTEDFVHESVSRPPGSREQFAQKIENFFTSFPGVKNYQADLLPYENYLVFDECTFEIPLPGTDKKVSIFHMDLVEMEGDKMKVKRSYGDGALMKAALNKIEPPFIKPIAATMSVPAPKSHGLNPMDAQHELLKRWNEQNLAGLAEMLHADAEILVSPLYSPVDRNSYIGWQELFLKAFPDLQVSAVATYAGDEWAMSEIKMTGTNTGSYMNNSATGKPIDIRAGLLTRFGEDGSVVSLKQFIDSMNVMKQLGLEPVSIK